jgi:hypothetical protein
MKSFRAYHCWGFALLLCTAAFLLPNQSQAQDPRRWGEDGIPLRQGHHIEWQRASYRNDDGQVLMVWSDTREGDRDIFAQLINPDGTHVFPEVDGKPITHDMFSRQEDPDPVAVDGGWIIAWIDFRTDSTGDIYAQKIDPNGVPLWTPGGVIVDVLDNSAVIELSCRAVHDGDGGAIIAWEDPRNDLGDIFAQHINSDGTRDWAQPLAVTDASGIQSGITADTDGDGNMILAWNDERINNDQNIYAAKITPEGTLPWGSGVNGILVCGAPGKQKGVKVCSDLTTNGLYCTWVDERNASNHNLYVQHIDGAGNVLWQNDGLLLCDAANLQGGVRVVPDMMPSGQQVGVLTVWEDQRTNSLVNEIYAQKTNAAGVHRWTANGIKVCGNAAPGASGQARNEGRLTSDMHGGAVYAWEDTRNVNGEIKQSDLYCARLDSNGNDLWQSEDGTVLVCEGDNAQASGVLRMMNDDTVIAIFDDESRGSQTLRYRRLRMSDGSGIEPDCGTELVFGLDGDAKDPQALPLPGNRVAIVWEDYRGGTNGNALFYQVTDTLHNFEKEANGDTLAPDNGEWPTYHQSNHQVAGGGSQGIFVSFIDLRTGVKEARLTRIDRNGEIACGDSAAVVYSTGRDQQDAFVCPDGNGGCYVAWSSFDMSFVLDAYLMHLNANCERTWDVPVQLSSTPEVDEFMAGVVTSSDGACIATWLSGDETTGQIDVFAARVGIDGTVSWNITVCDAPRRQSEVAIIADGEGGAFLAWADKRIEENAEDIYAQHLNAAGEEQWTTDDLLVNTAPDLQQRPQLVEDSEGNLYVLWQDYRSGSNMDIYGQKLAPDGTKLWEQNGRLISGANGDQKDHQLLLDRNDGIYSVWTDSRGFYEDIYGTHLNADGDTTISYYTEGSGGAICDFYQSQNQPTIADNGAQGVICAWVDWRSSGKDPLQNVWVNFVTDTTVIYSLISRPNLPNEYSLAQNYPNPFNPSTQFEFTIPVRQQVEISIYNTLGQQVKTLVNEVMAPGAYRVNFDASQLSSGTYFYRMTTPNYENVRKMTLVR